MTPATVAMFIGVIVVTMAIWNAVSFIGFWLWLRLGLIGTVVMIAAYILVTGWMLGGWFYGHIRNNIISRIYHRASWVVMGAYFYAFLFSGILALAFIPFAVTGNLELVDKWGIVVVVATFGLMVDIVAWGMVWARRIKVTRLEVRTPRLKKKRVRLVAISDTHIGTILGPRYFDMVRAIVKAEKPDIILCLGDILDINSELMWAWRPNFHMLFTHKPTYAVTGNHEYITNIYDSCKFLSVCGAKMVRDRIVVDKKHQVQFLGLEDPQGNSFFGDRGEAMERLLKEVDPKLPVVILQHQPLNFDIAVKHGAEVMLCGHTHSGQLWPFGYAVMAVFKKAWKGEVREGKTMLYTGNGTGVWGPPMRIGSTAEVIVVDLIRSPKGTGGS